MIRKWNSRKDNRRILQMIRSQLFPYVQQSHPHVPWNERAIMQKLNDGKVFVFSTNGKLTGFISAHSSRKSKNLWIDMLAVHGNRQSIGIGSHLLRHAEKWGKRFGCTTSSLLVNRTNERGIRFYFKHGYEPQQYEPLFDCYLLQKTFSRSP